MVICDIGYHAHIRVDYLQTPAQHAAARHFKHRDFSVWMAQHHARAGGAGIVVTLQNFCANLDKIGRAKPYRLTATAEDARKQSHSRGFAISAGD